MCTCKRSPTFMKRKCDLIEPQVPSRRKICNPEVLLDLRTYYLCVLVAALDMSCTHLEAVIASLIPYLFSEHILLSHCQPISQ